MCSFMGIGQNHVKSDRDARADNQQFEHVVIKGANK